MKKLIAMLLVCVFLLSGCYDKFRYSGKNKNYFSMAIYSLLGVSGRDTDKIEILEIDEYGRVLFSFYSSEILFGGEKGIYSIMVCQKTDEKNTYFYPDYQFVFANSEEKISEQDINLLRRRNDWGKELDESKMVKVKNTEKKRNVGSSISSREKKIFEGLIDFETRMVILTRLGMDKEKRNLYYVSVRDKENDYAFERAYILILNEDNTFDGNVCLQEVKNPWNYQDQLKAFKELNDWVLSEE